MEMFRNGLIGGASLGLALRFPKTGGIASVPLCFLLVDQGMNSAVPAAMPSLHHLEC